MNTLRTMSRTTLARAARRLSSLGALSAVATLALANPPAPQAAHTTVYRCGQTYQQVPCRDGQALAVSDGRDPAQRQAAQQAAAAEQRSANDLAAERSEREKALQPARRPTGVTRVAAVTVPTAPAAEKRPRSKAGKHPKTLEANDKTLYAARDKKLAPEAKMPAP